MAQRRIYVLAALIALVGLAWSFQSTPDFKVLFEKAKFAMETKGDLQGAIKIFQEIILKYPQEKEYAARAQLYIGLCFEKLGNSEAIKAYELVLKKYSDRQEEVGIARERLAALREEKSTGFSVIKLSTGDNYLEDVTLSPDGAKLLGTEFVTGQNAAFYDFVTQKLDLISHFSWKDEQISWANSCLWSPDGEEVAFEKNGKELWISTIHGKARLLLKNDEGGIIPCDWLRDGSGIVVLMGQKDKSHSIGLVPLSGGPVKTLCSIQLDVLPDRPAASPDGRYIVFENGSAGSRNIQIVGTEGQSSLVLTDHPADDKQPRWSPDGQNIVFLSQRHGGWALWSMAVKNGQPAGQPFMIKDGMQNARLLNWVSRGLVYVNSINIEDLFIQSLDPSTHELVGSPSQLEYAPTGGNLCPVWSPDGKYLAFASNTIDQPTRGHIVILPAEGGRAREFLIPVGYWGPFMSDLRWLPDSSGLGFSFDDDKGQRSLFQVQISTGEWKSWPIPVKSWTRIEWGNDGQSYFYAQHGFGDSEPGIIECDLATGNERYIYKPPKGFWGSFRHLRLSRDRKSIAFSENLKDKSQIVIVDLETGQARTVYSGSEGFASPAWSPDGQHLLLLSHFNKYGWPTEFGMIPASGGTFKKLDIQKSWPENSGFFSPDWSPDGKKIVFAVRSWKDEIFLIKNVLTAGPR